MMMTIKVEEEAEGGREAGNEEVTDTPITPIPEEVTTNIYDGIIEEQLSDDNEEEDKRIQPQGGETGGGEESEDDLGLSFISTTGDLYDDAVMGLLGCEEGGDCHKTESQKTNESSGSDDVFTGSPPTPLAIGAAGGGGGEINNLLRLRNGGGGTIIRMNSQGEEVNLGEESLGSMMTSSSWIDGSGGIRRHSSSSSQPTTRFAIYVGNLTWWTSHEDLKKACRLSGGLDVLDIKIFECRANGQSKGYALITFNSEESLVLMTEELQKTEIHGRTPIVKPDSKASAVYFDSLSKTRPPSSSTSSSSGGGSIGGHNIGGGDHSVSGFGGGGTRNTSGSGTGNGSSLMGAAPFGGGSGGSGGGSGRFSSNLRHHQFQNNHHHRNYVGRGGSGLLPNGPPPPRPWGTHLGPNSSSSSSHHQSHRYSPRIPGFLPPRVPPPPLSLAAAAAASYGHNSRSHYDDWRNPINYVPRVHFNPAFLNRLPMFQNDEYEPHPTPPSIAMEEGGSFYQYPPPSATSTSGDSGYPYLKSLPMDYEDHHQSRSPEGSLPLVKVKEEAHSSRPSTGGESSSQPLTSTSPTGSGGGGNDKQSLPKVELDEEELLERNNSICSQAIQRAVSDASNGDYASSIETLVTAISLIRGSKVANDNRCKVLVSSLQHSLEGIENRSYGKQKSERSSGSETRGGSYVRRSPTPYRSSRSSHYYDYRADSGRYYSEDSKDRISSSSRRRTWDDRDDERGMDHSRGSKLCRIEDGKDCYRR